MGYIRHIIFIIKGVAYLCGVLGGVFYGGQ